MYTNALGWWKVSRRQLKNVHFSDFTNVQCLGDRAPVAGTAVSRSVLCYTYCMRSSMRTSRRFSNVSKARTLRWMITRAQHWVRRIEANGPLFACTRSAFSPGRASSLTSFINRINVQRLYAHVGSSWLYTTLSKNFWVCSHSWRYPASEHS